MSVDWIPVRYRREFGQIVQGLGSSNGLLENQNLFFLYFDESNRLLTVEDQPYMPKGAQKTGDLVCYINKASAKVVHSLFQAECMKAGIQTPSVILVEVSAEGWASSVRIVTVQHLSGGKKWGIVTPGSVTK